MYLVGVSHGAPASAKLVGKTIRDVNPSAIVLELCNDRYLSISLDAKIKPKLCGNYTMPQVYEKKLKKLEELEKNQKGLYWKSNLKFIRSQGFLVGGFIGMG